MDGTTIRGTGGEAKWEAAGIIAGFFGCACIANQAYAEWTANGPSSLSLPYTAGFLLIFIFWTSYGARFRRTALWTMNGVAALLQTALIAISIWK